LTARTSFRSRTLNISSKAPLKPCSQRNSESAQSIHYDGHKVPGQHND
jgi:hypothetical protein